MGITLDNPGQCSLGGEVRTFLFFKKSQVGMNLKKKRKRNKWENIQQIQHPEDSSSQQSKIQCID